MASVSLPEEFTIHGLPIGKLGEVAPGVHVQVPADDVLGFLERLKGGKLGPGEFRVQAGDWDYYVEDCGIERGTIWAKFRRKV